MYIYHNRSKDEYKAFKFLKEIAGYMGVSYHTLQKHFAKTDRYDKGGITIHRDNV